MEEIILRLEKLEKSMVVVQDLIKVLFPHKGDNDARMDTHTIPCKFFLYGNCIKGLNCNYSHATFTPALVAPQDEPQSSPSQTQSIPSYSYQVSPSPTAYAQPNQQLYSQQPPYVQQTYQQQGYPYPQQPLYPSQFYPQQQVYFPPNQPFSPAQQFPPAQQFLPAQQYIQPYSQYSSVVSPNFSNHEWYGASEYPHSLPTLEVQKLSEVVDSTNLATIRLTIAPSSDDTILEVPRYISIHQLKEIIIQKGVIKDVPNGILEDGMTAITTAKFILLDERYHKAPSPENIASWKSSYSFKVFLHLLPKGVYSYEVRDVQVVDNKLQPRVESANPYSTINRELQHIHKAFFLDTNVVLYDLQTISSTAHYRNKSSLFMVTETVIKEYSRLMSNNLRNVGGIFVVETKLHEKRGELLFGIFYEQFMARLPSKHGFNYPTKVRDYMARHVSFYHNDLFDFLIFLQANFTAAQFKALYPNCVVEFYLVTGDKEFLSIYNNEHGLFALQHLKINELIKIIPVSGINTV